MTAMAAPASWADPDPSSEASAASSGRIREAGLCVSELPARPNIFAQVKICFCGQCPWLLAPGREYPADTAEF